MRNLTLSASCSKQCQNCRFSATVIDPEQECLWAISERVNADADLEVEVWKDAPPCVESDASNNSGTSLATMFTSTTNRSIPSDVSQIASLRVRMDDRQLVVITRGGDIATMGLDDEDYTVDIVGSFEDGILAAAWSPDDLQLVLVTGGRNLIIMNYAFDVLSETPLHTEAFGEDAPINVGWGSKQTQFHGSLGKAAAQAAPPSAANSIGPSPDDDTLPRISWRGDGAFFVVSALSPVPPSSDSLSHRVLRVYSREGALQSTSEAVGGLEHPLAWRPSGNLIVSTQRFGSFKGAGKGREGRHDIVFFERNGLRHGEFTLREASQAFVNGSVEPRSFGYKVRELSWSSDSNVLAVWIESEEGDVVQLWTTGNYHWYLKQEISAPSSTATAGRFTSINWHPERDLQLILTTQNEIIYRTYVWDTYASRTAPPVDSGSVAVVDGVSILLTPFRTQNVPPPMAAHTLTISPPPIIATPSTVSSRALAPIHMSFSPVSDVLAILWESGKIDLWDLHTRLGPGRGKVIEPKMVWGGFVQKTDDSRQFREIGILTPNGGAQTEGISAQIALLGNMRGGSDFLEVVDITPDGITRACLIDLDGLGWRLVVSDDAVACHHLGKVYTVDVSESTLSPPITLGTPCDLIVSTNIREENSSQSTDATLFIGLARSGELLAATTDPEHRTRSLARNANSFTIAADFVIYTTTAHEAHFVPVNCLRRQDEIVDETRRVERGARIVTAVPSTMSLVLQMPRGNLETINPRPLVMRVVKQDIDVGKYLKAFLACRKHRIDLNVIVDHDPAKFRERLSSFLDQVDDVDFINLFLTNLGNAHQPAATISELCDAIREELEKRDLIKYVNSILTAYVVKKPADHEAALRVLLRIRDSEPATVEEAVKYIIFLVDAETLFDVALGMYDFSLVLMIAQHAQKDPREYLPFLRELRALEKFYQRYRIDDHLRRYESALINLKLAGPEHFDEAVSYIEKHQLYSSALSIWREANEYTTVLSLYGEWLYERRNFKQSAIVFVEAQKPFKALIAYEKGLQWRELFDLAVRENTSQDDLADMGYRVAEDLTSKKKYSDASRVLLDYSKDVRQAVIALVQGSEFSEARRIITLHSCSELIEDVVHPGALEARSQITEELGEMREQLRKQRQRVNELRIKKVEEPEAFYGTEDTDLHNVDVMTDASQFTAFTRYTAAPSTASKASKRSSRSKRKMERKVGSGRKGTVDEEEYLLKSITKLAGRFATTQDESSNLVQHLLQFTEEHRTEARSLQEEVSEFEAELREALAEIWPTVSGELEDEEPQDSWAIRMAEKEKERESAIKRLTKPDIRGDEWRTKLFDVGS
ncbi:Elongator complex protein 1 [Dentipellis sp. KUC8613]|nr:Elongator complex protein 1 [Dentipellis sp. KUC8613]